MTLYKWSQTAALDASADSTINWAEGQSPSSVNDSGRAMMAATAKYRDDIAGAIVTSGTSTAYLVSSYQGFDSAAHLGGQTIAFTPHVTNGATVTLNVDGLGARPLRASPGSRIAGWNHHPGHALCRRLQQLRCGVLFARSFTATPTTYRSAQAWITGDRRRRIRALHFRWGRRYRDRPIRHCSRCSARPGAAGDGSTTFNLPDKRGRVSIVKDDMGGSSAFRVTNAVAGFAGDTLGAAGGSQSHTLTLAECLPASLPLGSTRSP